MTSIEDKRIEIIEGIRKTSEKYGLPVIPVKKEKIGNKIKNE